MKKNSFLLLMALASVHCNVHGQSVIYTYNSQGSCISRVYATNSAKARKFKKATFLKESIKVVVSPSASFENQITISVTGLSSDCSLNYFLSNVSGQIVSIGRIGQTPVVLDTSPLPKGIYILKVKGEITKTARNFWNAGFVILEKAETTKANEKQKTKEEEQIEEVIKLCY